MFPFFIIIINILSSFLHKKKNEKIWIQNLNSFVSRCEDMFYKYMYKEERFVIPYGVLQ